MTTRDDISIRPKAEDSQAHIKRADLIGQSYRERHQGQRHMSAIKGRTYGRTAPLRSDSERALDRGVVPHMGIPSRVTLAYRDWV